MQSWEAVVGIINRTLFLNDTKKVKCYWVYDRDLFYCDCMFQISEIELARYPLGRSVEFKKKLPDGTLVKLGKVNKQIVF